MKRINYNIETDFLQFEDVSYDIKETRPDYTIDADTIVFGVAEKSNRSIINGKQTPISTRNDLIVMNVPAKVTIGGEVEGIISSQRRSSGLSVAKTKIISIIEEYIGELSDEIKDLPTESYYQPFLPFCVYKGQRFLSDKVLAFREVVLLNDKKLQHKILDMKLDELLIYCLQSNVRKQLLESYQQGSTQDQIGTLIHLIQTYPEKNWTIDDLAKKIDASPATIHRYFKKALGISPNQYIWNSKLNVAKKILKERYDLNVYEVGRAIGIENSAYFTKMFKKYVGQTPVVYRNTYAKKEIFKQPQKYL